MSESERECVGGNDTNVKSGKRGEKNVRSDDGVCGRKRAQISLDIGRRG